MSGEEDETDNFLFAGRLSERKVSNYMQEYVLYYEFYTVGTLFRKGSILMGIFLQFLILFYVLYIYH